MVEILFCLMSTLENCLISTYLLWFSTRIQMEKNWGDTPSATLILKNNEDGIHADIKTYFQDECYWIFAHQTVLASLPLEIAWADIL